ncbi:fungal-specific transcription factor domain-containing protein [Aspergillus ambiguus]|uniref:transcription factor domain-containing protein n=1 Tax=Aspergillus ambiguus TaxID=176160 RepID=UPI003CCE37E3
MARHHKIVCSNCRRRKSKCDGASPSCSACLASGAKCHYDKSPSLAYVRSLQSRIRELESKVNVEATSPSQSSFASPAFSSRGCDSISLDALGDVSYHNPTSAIHENLPQGHATPSHVRTHPSPAADERALDIGRRLVANAAAQKDFEVMNLDASLPLTNLSKDLASTLLQLHWCWLHPSFLFVYRPAFTRDMPLLASGDRSSTNCTSTLLKVLYAHSCRFIRSPDTIWSSDSHKETFQELSDRLMSEAKALLAMETLNPPSIPTIQALLQQSARDVASGLSSSAWLYSGMAFRMAIDLGLHVCPDKLQQYSTSLSIEDIEIRKRLFWSLYTWDKHISLYLGRMPNFVMGAENVSLQFLDDFTDNEPWVPFYGPDPNASELPTYPPTPGRVMSCFTHLCKLCRILTRVMLELYSSQCASHSEYAVDTRAAAFVAIKQELQDWYSSLPSYLRIPPENMPELSPPPHITSLNLMYHNALILLHRPHVASGEVPRSATIRQSWKICRSATTAIYGLLKMYIHTFGFHHITYMNSYCTYTAATTAVYQLETLEDGLQPAQSHQAAWTELRFLLDVLRRTSKAMPGLNRSIDIIKARIKKILDSQVARQLDSLFPGQEWKESGNSISNDTPRQSHIAENNNGSNNAPDRSSAVPAFDWEIHMGSMADEDTWLPAFLAQDISYGPEVMLDVQDGLSPQTRSALMGSNLDPQLRLNLSVPDTVSYGPFHNTLLGQLPNTPAGETNTSSY